MCKVLFQKWYMPEIKNTLESFSPDSQAGSAAVNLNAKGINQSFDATEKQTNQMLSRQNLQGTGAGLALIAGNQRARASALADAYAKSMATSNQNKAQMLSNMGTLMPSTTTSTPILTQSSSYAASITG